MMVTAAVSVTDLTKTYRSGLFRKTEVEALRGVTLQVAPGEIFGLIGPNGAGKTTLIKILLGLVRRTSGEAQLLGVPAGDRHGRVKVGYLPEGHRIPLHLTANSALEYYGELSNLPLSVIRERRPALLKQLGLTAAADRSVSGYSKGMLQRLGLAQALLHDPDLLFLDEPTDGVDPRGRAEIRKLLTELKGQGKSIFINSHQLQELELVCDRVAMMEKGKLLYVGGVDTVTNGENGTEFEVQLSLLGDRDTIVRALGPSAQCQAPRAGVVEVKLLVEGQTKLDQLIDSLRSQQVSIIGLTRHRRTLEQAYLEMVEK
ncbi:MAG: ABC transporter ATP-binding protein [Planctomycetaceae bacterium]